MQVCFYFLGKKPVPPLATALQSDIEITHENSRRFRIWQFHVIKVIKNINEVWHVYLGLWDRYAAKFCTMKAILQIHNRSIATSGMRLIVVISINIKATNIVHIITVWWAQSCLNKNVYICFLDIVITSDVINVQMNRSSIMEYDCWSSCSDTKGTRVASALNLFISIIIFLLTFIDLFHNGDQIWYSFVLMLISLISLASMGTIQKNVSIKERPVGLININTMG